MFVVRSEYSGYSSVYSAVSQDVRGSVNCQQVTSAQPNATSIICMSPRRQRRPANHNTEKLSTSSQIGIDKTMSSALAHLRTLD